MKQLIEAFEALFVNTAQSDKRLSKTAALVLSSVNWKAETRIQKPECNSVVELHLEGACRGDAETGSSAHSLARALLPVARNLHWRMRQRDTRAGNAVAIFSRNYTAVTIVGADGIIASDRVIAGFSLQAPDTYYPPHAHHAEESYWIVGGRGDWKVDESSWFPVRAGDSIYHQPWAVHAMRTGVHPLLSVWLWTSHLDSEVVMLGPTSQNHDGANVRLGKAS